MRVAWSATTVFGRPPASPEGRHRVCQPPTQPFKKDQTLPAPHLLQLCLASVLVAASLPVGAEALRCGNNLVSPGDTKMTVIQKCGEPARKDYLCKRKRSYTRFADGVETEPVLVTVCDQVEDWTYDAGPGTFLTVLRFEQNELKSVLYGERSN